MSTATRRIARRLFAVGFLAACIATVLATAQVICTGGTLAACQNICLQNLSDCLAGCEDIVSCIGFCNRVKNSCIHRCELNCPS